ncbi:MAG: ankyrin repeat domain-containing protein [Planctomycetia bacterium]|nr:ankyrin repeat domain-containing protein [Planctomycetia bacterium]
MWKSTLIRCARGIEAAAGSGVNSVGFTVWYRSSNPHSDADRIAIERAAADLCQGRTWLSCEPVFFFADSGDGRIVGGSKPNFTPHAEEIKSADATGLPDGTIRDAVDVLCQISRIHGVDWEITHQEGGDWIGHIRAGDAEKELLDRVSAFAEASTPSQRKASSHIPPLLKCLMGRNTRKLKKLLENGENPNEDAYVETALSVGNIEAAELLLDFGAKPRIAQGLSTLTYVAPLRAVALMSRLIDMGQDINGGASSSTPLVHAAGYGDLESVEFLVSRGAAIDRPANGGITPLMSAAFWGHASVVRVLLERGATPTLRDESGRSAADYAALPWSAMRDGVINTLMMGSNANISEKNQVAAMFDSSIASNSGANLTDQT